MSLPIDRMETRRVGSGRGPLGGPPHLAEKGEPDASHTADARSVAAFLGSVEVPPRGSHRRRRPRPSGQPGAGRIDRAQIQNVDAARASLEETRRWWLGVVNTVKVGDEQRRVRPISELAEIPGDRGAPLGAARFYQTSGAWLGSVAGFGQPDLGRSRPGPKTILLHASQQFLEGTWFTGSTRCTTDGRRFPTDPTLRTTCSGWFAAAAEYTRLTGDEALWRRNIVPFGPRRLPSRCRTTSTAGHHLPALHAARHALPPLHEGHRRPRLDPTRGEHGLPR